MSRIGKQPVIIPNDVKVSVNGNTVSIDGPKGKLSNSFHQDIKIEYNQQEKQVLVTRPSDEKKHRALHGLTRSLIANMVLGVTKGYSKNLEIVGIGYNAKVQGKD
ncbi:MAG: 50S ribosomal protein L6, partial [Planctomycetes bacterium]|nr:50S ribosomal protein L6 [Planctomycetota bacterium]